VVLDAVVPRHADEKQRLQMRGSAEVGEGLVQSAPAEHQGNSFVQLQTKEELLLDSCVSNVVLNQITDPGCCWSAMTASGGDGALELA
jgi:hypothetical protein